MDEAHLMCLRGHVADVILVGEDQPRSDPVFALACPAVGSLHIVLLVALAIEGALRVDALLRACPGHRLALIDVGTSLLVGHQLVTRIAFASERLLGVDALVATAVVLHSGTLIYVAM